MEDNRGFYTIIQASFSWQKRGIMQLQFTNAALHKQQVKRLYTASFPKAEQAPLFYLYYKAKRGVAQFSAVMDGEKFVGLTYAIPFESSVLLMFLAVDDAARDQGYGSQILAALRKRYPHKRIFLTIEVVDQAAANYKQRLRRKAFYQRNQFESAGFTVREGGVLYEVLSCGGAIRKEEYRKNMEKLFGRFLYSLLARA